MAGVKSATDEFEAANPGISTDIAYLELLSTEKAGAGDFEISREANPEYPFVSKSLNASHAILTNPSDYFDKGRSVTALQSAWNVLSAIIATEPFAALNLELPPRR